MPTYGKNLALGVDMLGAAVLFNQTDLTISSLCYLVRASAGRDGAPPVRVENAKLALTRINPYRWQVMALRWIGDGLEFFWPGHCAGARVADIARSTRAQNLLS